MNLLTSEKEIITKFAATIVFIPRVNEKEIRDLLLRDLRAVHSLKKHRKLFQYYLYLAYGLNV